MKPDDVNRNSKNVSIFFSMEVNIFKDGSCHGVSPVRPRSTHPPVGPFRCGRCGRAPRATHPILKGNDYHFRKKYIFLKNNPRFLIYHEIIVPAFSKSNSGFKTPKHSETDLFGKIGNPVKRAL